MRQLRWAAPTAVLAGVLTAALVGAPAAWGAIAEKEPAEGSVVGGHASLPFTSTIQVATTLDAVGPSAEPDGPATVVAGGRNAQGYATLLLKTRCPTDPGAECAGGAVAPNGLWTVHERGVGAGPPRSFFVRIGGLPVSEVKASLEGRTATVTWKPGPEADVTGWQVSDGQDQTQTVKPAACKDGVCSATVEYPPTASGPRTFSVRAARPCGSEDCKDVLGAAATGEDNKSTVQLPAPAAQPADPAPSGGTSAPPGTGGTGSGGTAGLSAFSPKLGVPKLPPLPSGGAPIAAPEVADTFDERLDYGDRELPEIADDEDVPRAGRDDSRLTSTGGLDEQVVRGIAAAMVLGLTGAHLRTWLARTRDEDLELEL